MISNNLIFFQILTVFFMQIALCAKINNLIHLKGKKLNLIIQENHVPFVTQTIQYRMMHANTIKPKRYI
jgi:hypothetical protein